MFNKYTHIVEYIIGEIVFTIWYHYRYKQRQSRKCFSFFFLENLVHCSIRTDFNPCNRCSTDRPTNQSFEWKIASNSLQIISLITRTPRHCCSHCFLFDHFVRWFFATFLLDYFAVELFFENFRYDKAEKKKLNEVQKKTEEIGVQVKSVRKRWDVVREQNNIFRPERFIWQMHQFDILLFFCFLSNNR